MIRRYFEQRNARADARVLDFLDIGGSWYVHEIADAMCMSHNRTHASVARLFENRQVEFTDKGAIRKRKGML